MQYLFILEGQGDKLAKCQIVVLWLKKEESLSDLFLLILLCGQRVKQVVAIGTGKLDDKRAVDRVHVGELEGIYLVLISKVGTSEDFGDAL